MKKISFFIEFDFKLKLVYKNTKFLNCQYKILLLFIVLDTAFYRQLFPYLFSDSFILISIYIMQSEDSCKSFFAGCLSPDCLELKSNYTRCHNYPVKRIFGPMPELSAGD